MDGEIIQQRSSYRQGLVLGLTMAEIMLLLVFCLLIVMATFLTAERTKRVTAEQKFEQLQTQNERDRDVVATLRQNPTIADKLQSLSGLTDPKEIDKYWRELVDSRTSMVELEKAGVSVKELRDRIADTEKLRSNGIDVDKALRDSDVIGAINHAMTKPGQPQPSTLSILDAIERGMTGPVPGGHQWPPIITLSEAGGYHFKTGSAELSQEFREALLTKTPQEILGYIKQYDVDVIEVVGHTDEQPFGVRQSNTLGQGQMPVVGRQSNLDHDLALVLKNGSAIAKLVPADNAGLGLARAVSVVSVLRQNSSLSGYKLIPLSGAQLVNTDETLAIAGSPGDIPQRRRIEIRLRKSVPVDATASIAPMPIVAPARPRPVAKQPPLSLKPTPRPASRLFAIPPN